MSVYRVEEKNPPVNSYELGPYKIAEYAWNHAAPVGFSSTFFKVYVAGRGNLSSRTFSTLEMAIVFALAANRPGIGPFTNPDPNAVYAEAQFMLRGLGYAGI